MILIAYDGSEDARAAVDHVATLIPGADVNVVTVWEPFISALMRSGSLTMGLEFAAGATDSVAIDRDYRTVALATASEGADRATAAGLHATPLAERRRGDIAHTILGLAESLPADLIVVGTRGLSEVKTLMLGGVSHELVQHASRPVLVVPSERVATRRRRVFS